MKNYTTLEDIRNDFENLMSWDKTKFACEIQNYSECPKEEEKLSPLDLLENAGYTLKDAIDEYPTITEAIDDLGGTDAILDWIDEKDIVKYKKSFDILDAMNKEDIIEYISENEVL